jgi:hypothetical protein
VLRARINSTRVEESLAVEGDLGAQLLPQELLGRREPSGLTRGEYLGLCVEWRKGLWAQMIMASVGEIIYSVTY